MKTNRISALLAAVIVALTALADGPFREHRYDSFKATPTEPGQIIFAGNSITNMHSWFEAFGSHQEVIGRGNSGGFAYELLDNLESYIDSKPAKFFVMIGTNDISSGQSVDVTARRIQTIVRRVRLESPETYVYVQSILPRSSNPKPDYELCNTVMKQWIEQLNDTKVNFVNLSEVCAGVNGNSWWAYDGLHPRSVGYAAWTNHIEDLVGYPSIYPDQVTDQSNSCGLGGVSASRAEQFAFYPTMPGDVFFFGDEQVHGGEWHELFRSPKIKDRGMQWGWGGITLDKAKNVVANSLTLHETKPAKIFLFYGIGGTNETNYRAIVDAAKSNAPEAQVFIVSLSPSTNADTDAARVTFNSKLQTIAQEKQVTYIDIYTPLKQDLAKNIMHTNYISGRGYVIMANTLAPYLAEQEVNPVSLDEYDALYARRSARKIIGDALTSAMILNYGSGLGQIAETYRDEIEALYPALAQAVNDPNLTLESANNSVAQINQLITDSYAGLNLPQTSTDSDDFWYTLTSARGTVSTLTAADGKLVGGAAPDKYTDGANVWKFISKDSSSYYIINGKGEYLSPSASFNSQLKTSKSAPSKGWQISYSSAYPGAYVIYSDNAQINQTNQNNAVFNWYNTTTPDRNDQGCAYYISLFGGIIGEPEPIEIPNPVLTLLNKEFNGTNPFRVPDQLAEPVLASAVNSVALEVTLTENPADFAAFAAATSTQASNAFFSVGEINNGRVGVRYIGQQGTEGWYTVTHSYGHNNVKLVVVNDPDAGYSVYVNGSLIRLIPASGLGAYGFKHFGNVTNADALYLGGFVTADNAAKYAMKGTIHSARFWDCILSEEQVSVLSYTGLVESEVDEISEVQSCDNAPKATFDMLGRKVLAPTRGFYIINGKKTFIP